MYSLGTNVSPRPSVASTRAASTSPPSTFLTAVDNNSNNKNNKAAAAAASTQVYATTDLPRNEEDVTQYVLYDGLPQSGPAVRHARERQAQAFLHFTHRIRERCEAAHAIVLSANPLSLSVMASQLRMYRWKVTEAQTLLETTSLLQDFVMDTSKHGYRVRRRPAAPLGMSRYAHGRGKKALRRIAQEEREKLAGSSGGVVTLPGAATNAGTSLPSSSRAAAPRARADNNNNNINSTTAATNAADEKHGSVKRGRRTELLSQQQQQQQRQSPHTAATPLAADHHHPEGADTMTVMSADDSDTTEGKTEADPYEEREEDRLPLPPSDALPRLVLVDGFTHEDFADIARHIRFVDKEHGLELLLVLLLPTDPQAAAVATQGAGVVVTPQHETTMEDAYKAGYDLVLAHNMDNLLVDFLTNAFVSSVGRWRNDVRSKAAVGNYMSLRNVLLGGLDTASLQQLVWDDNTDDAEVLELLGAQSLSMQGGAKRYSEASRQLLDQRRQQEQQRQAALAAAAGAGEGGYDGVGESSLRLTTSLMTDGDPHVDNTNDDDEDAATTNKMKRVASSMMSNVPRLRSRPTSVAHFGVRLPADQQSAQVPLASFGRTKDVLSGVMGSRLGNNSSNSGAASNSGRRRRHFNGSDEEDEDEAAYYSDGLGEDQKMLRVALEKEMGRLMAENDGKQASIDALQKEVESLHRTVAILKRRLPGGGTSGGGGGSGAGLDLDSFTLHGGGVGGERPDSGSMVHLGKQQQIYILKERLEAANDHIVALLKDGHGMDGVGNASSTNNPNGGNGANARGRGGNGATKGNNRGGGNARSNNNNGGGGGHGNTLMAPAAAARRAAAAGAFGHGGGGAGGGPDVYRRRACEAYQAAREAEMMLLLDDDAHYVNATLAQLPQHGSTLAAASAGGEGSGPNRATSAQAQRREREATDQVMHALQGELRSLQSRLDDSTNGSAGNSVGGDLQARMATHLQAALERLEAQRQRVRHLEQLRQTDQLLLTHAVRVNEHVKRELSAARRGEAADTDSYGTAGGDDYNSSDDRNPQQQHGHGGGTRTATGSSGGSHRRGRRAGKGTTGRGRGKKGTNNSTSNSNNNGGGGDGVAGRDRSSGRKKGTSGASATGAASTATTPNKGKGNKRRAADEADVLDAAQVEGLIAAAVTDAVAARNRVFRRQLGALVQTCKAQLTRVVLKHQKPRTIAYVQMLQEELEQAKRDQKGALMRLQFTLSHLRPDQYDASSIPQSDGGDVKDKADLQKSSNNKNNDNGKSEDDAGSDESRMIPLRAVTDADVRRAAERVAREHAAFALRVAYMTAELQRVHQQPQSQPQPSSPAHGRRHNAATVTGSTGNTNHHISNKKASREGDTSNTASSPTKAAGAGTGSGRSTPQNAPSRPASSASPEQLLRAYQHAAQHVKAAIDGVSPVQTYLDAVQAEMEAEQRLSPWCEVDCTQLFQSLPTPSSNYAVVTPPAHLALVPTNLRQTFPSASEFTLPSTEESVPLYLADVDGSVRDVADVYGTMLRGFVTLGEGWTAGYYNNNNNNVSTTMNTNALNNINNSGNNSGDHTKTDEAGIGGSGGGAGRPARRAPHGKGGKTASRAGNASSGSNPSSKTRRRKSLDSGELRDDEDAADMDDDGAGGEDGGDTEDVARPLSRNGRNVLTFQQALLQLPVEHREVSQYQGRLDGLYTADIPYSPAQRRLYEILLRAYQQRCINPLHMAGLEMTVLTTTGGSSSSAVFNVAALTAAQAQHREVVGLLQLLAPTATPALRSLHQQIQQAQRLLDREENEGVAPAPRTSTSTRTAAPARTSAAFLSAVDAALLGCVVDELRWRQWRRAQQAKKVAATAAGAAAAATDGAATATATTTGEVPAKGTGEESGEANTTLSVAAAVDVDTTESLVAALVAARTTAGRSGDLTAAAGAAPLLRLPVPRLDWAENDKGSDGADAAADARVVRHYTTFCATRARAAGQGTDSNSVDGGDALRQHNLLGEDLFDFADLSPALANMRNGSNSSNSSVEAYQRLASLLPNLNGGAAAGADTSGAGRAVAQELAEYFSKRRATANKSVDSATAAAEAEAEAAFLTDIYLNDGSLSPTGGSGGNGEGADDGDENTQAIRRLRLELTYMEAVKQQRMAELAMRCEWHLRGRDGSRGSAHGRRPFSSNSLNTQANAAAYPDIDPERLNFTVKSGTSAWYGMEAAKRVRAILRRRARPDQIIVGGGPEGGGVGIELSRRTAQPAVTPPLLPNASARTRAAMEAAAAKTRAANSNLANNNNSNNADATGEGGEENNGYQVEDEDDSRSPRYSRKGPPGALPSVASHFQQHSFRRPPASHGGVVPLPPLLPQQQQQQQQQRLVCMGRPTFTDQQPQPPQLPGPASYVSPRDAVSLSAYANLASGCDMGSNYHLSAGVGGYDDGDAYGAQGGGAAGYYTVTGAAEDLSSRVMAYRAELTRAAGRLSPTSTATYANGAPFSLPLAGSPSRIPNNNNNSNGQGNREMTGGSTGLRPRPPLPQQTSWVYGVPTSTAAHLVQQQGEIDPHQPRDTVLFMPPRNRSSIAETAERNRAAQTAMATTPRRGLRIPPSTTATALSPAGLSAYRTPAAMAALRLQTMLTASMADPSMVGLAASAAGGARGGGSIGRANIESGVLAGQRASHFTDQSRPAQLQRGEGSRPSSTPTTPRAQAVDGSTPAPANAAAAAAAQRSASAREPLPHDLEKVKGAVRTDGPVTHFSTSTLAHNSPGLREGSDGASAGRRSGSAASEAEHPVELETTVKPEAHHTYYDEEEEEEEEDEEGY